MNNILIRDLVEAIPRRHSVRQYTAKEIPNDLLNRLMVSEGIRRLDLTGCRVELVHVPGELDNVFSGIIGNYGKIKGSSALIALLVPEDSGELGLLEAGYVGEQYVLRATSLGLATCWVGGMFRFKTLMGRLSIGPAEKVAAIISVGWPISKTDPMANLVHLFVKRKTLEQIVHKDLLQSAGWVRTAAEAVRIAPSAVHRQPWFLSGTPARVVLSPTRQGGFTSMDLGIAMLHFELASEHAGQIGKWHVGPELYFS
ncbi:MAG: nitroreductase family protein [Bacillota bacterium]|nr:nitroreductase family protein [Bacillota bacterium]